MWGGGPQPPLASSPSRTSSSRKPKLQRIVAKSHSRLCGAENTREKRALRRAEIRRGNSLPEGEIIAIVTVIELDFIGSSSSSSPPPTSSSPPLHLVSAVTSRVES
jgi:hypothetical protein